MTPEQLVEKLKLALPAGLKSVVLYGSAAAGDHVHGASDYNVLLIAERLGPVELLAISGPAEAWTKSGNRPPLLFTLEEFARSADAFPVELLDIQQSHRVLFGADPVARIPVDPRHLRLEIERELKARLLALREGYILSRGRPKPVARLLTSSLSTFLVLFRAALRLWQDVVPAQKHEALLALAGHIGFDPQAFLTVKDWRERRAKPGDGSVGAVFEAYLSGIERVIHAVDLRVRE